MANSSRMGCLLSTPLPPTRALCVSRVITSCSNPVVSAFTSTSTLPISIEVSGNGKLPFPAIIPGSGLPTRYDRLHIFLVSSQTSINATVSVGPGLLTDESGSVRHLNWDIPSCILTGLYNLTFYESAHIDNDSFFTITAIPISIVSNNPSGNCGDILNPLQAQPQPAAPFGRPFFLQSDVPVPTGELGSFPSAVNSNPTATVLVSVATVTTTLADGQNPLTTADPTSSTNNPEGEDFSGFLPVNASPKWPATDLSSWCWSTWLLGMVLASL
ncbi:hypothetical protein AX16_009558 [Volvariella volvacea WC 439]|nr:hypothetical protein AX16_009558 [Volvariella volvacea WC 439]